MANDPRGEYEDSVTVDADASAVFDFVSDVRNLPKYLPTTKDAQTQGEGRVRVQGEAQGNRYNPTATCGPIAPPSVSNGARTRVIIPAGCGSSSKATVAT
ncbi:MAG: hypothetical protein AVDCRST_MAG62-277 [uncultured Sphingomonas sp.]|uniref:Uncharacterized protein n=1 Tax=uncultured Sphingomonas sp. TaxID=158754 RepID=A0A6J4SW31_9SPHN|nr:MAG: hypothetical protein AVDCRST_MAG62-277 [uncultured Sphingomonas sp.]